MTRTLLSMVSCLRDLEYFFYNSKLYQVLVMGSLDVLGDSQEEADDSDMDHSGQTDSNSSGYFMPGPPPSPAESEFIDVEKLSIGKAKTEENNQYVDMLTSTPARAFDVFCPRSGLKRRVNSDDGQLQSIVPCKAPRLHMPAQHQHQQFEGKVSLFSEPCDLLKSKSLSFNLKKSERKLQSGSLCNGNNIPSLKPQCTMRKLETSEQTEATGGVIERFFNWLFPDE